MKELTYKQSLAYIFEQIPYKIEPDTRAGFGAERVKYFLKKLDNPQEKYPVIHVAGTSGKGSTCSLISHLLTAAGFKTGLTVSPHVNDLRERVQINNKLIDKHKFVRYFNDLYPQLQTMKESNYGMLSYFEIMVSLAFYAFAQEQVDYGVIEVGMGGLNDRTNCINRCDKISVINRIGFDHTEILGNTLEAISSRKAGIILPHSVVFLLNQPGAVNKTVSDFAAKQSANLKIISTASLTDRDYYTDIPLLMRQSYQQDNLSLALAVCQYLSERDGFGFSAETILSALKTFSIPGRLDRRYYGTTEIILDGAHNPQKISALSDSLRQLYPHKKFNFLLAVKQGKHVEEMLPLLLPLAEKIYLTDFTTSDQDISHLSLDPLQIEKILKRQNFSNIEIINDKNQLPQLWRKSPTKIWVATGSLYFLNDIYRLLKQ